jgi:transposase
LGLVSRLSQLDRLRETMRLLLESMAEEGWKRPPFWEMYWERYVESKVDYRSGSDVLKQKLAQVGEDIRRLVKWLSKTKRCEDGGKGGARLEMLKKMFDENFQVDPEHGHVEVLKMTSESRIQNPHDPEASFRAKQDKKWVGYNVQVAETLPKKEGTGFITSMVAQTARGSDEAGLEQTLDEQSSMGFARPKELIVDGAYLSAQKLAEADEEQWRLTGPVMPPHAAKGCYGVDQFRVNIATRQARCPAGRVSTQCSKIEDRYNEMIEYRFEWSWKCQGCALRAQCISSTQDHRTIRVRDNFMYLQARRAEMKTERFKERMKRRAGIEGTLSELVRGYGIRRARYRGLAKMRLQSYFTAAACNVARWIRRIHRRFVDICVEIFQPLSLFQCVDGEA